MSSEFVAKHGQWKNIAGPANEDENDAPNDQGDFDLVGETEDGQTKIGKHAGLADEGQRAHGLLHCNLGHWNKAEKINYIIINIQ